MCAAKISGCYPIIEIDPADSRFIEYYCNERFPVDWISKFFKVEDVESAVRAMHFNLSSTGKTEGCCRLSNSCLYEYISLILAPDISIRT